jgi:hypothetical protein
MLPKGRTAGPNSTSLPMAQIKSTVVIVMKEKVFCKHLRLVITHHRLGLSSRPHLLALDPCNVLLRREFEIIQIRP